MLDAIVFCNPILDLVASCDKSWFESYQLIEDDYTEYQEHTHHDIYDQLWSRPDVKKLPGGSGQNVARMLKACWRSVKPEKSVGFVGCVGEAENGLEDQAALIMREVAERRDGLTCFYDRKKGASTGMCAVCINPETRTRSLCTRLGASVQLSDQYIKSLEPIYSSAAVICVTGYFVTANEQAMKQIFTHPACRGKLVLTLSAPFIVENYRATMKYCGHRASVFVQNDSEWLSYAKHVVLPHGDTSPKSDCSAASTTEGEGPQQAARGLLERLLGDWCMNGTNNFDPTGEEAPSALPYRLAICTRGPTDCLVGFTAEWLHRPLICRVPVKAVANIVDTNGAGDAFLGALISQLGRLNETEQSESAMLNTLRQIVERANQAAAAVVQKSGFDFEPEALTFF